MTDLFKLQTDAGRLWPDILTALNEQSKKAQADMDSALAAKEVELANLRDSIVTQLANQKTIADTANSYVAIVTNLVTDIKAKFTAGDYDGITALIAESEKSEKQKRIETLTAQRDALNDEISATQADTKFAEANLSES